MAIWSVARGVTRLFAAVLLLIPLMPDATLAQGTADDYRRALDLDSLYEGLVVNVVDGVRWSADDRFAFRRSVPGGHHFLASTLTGVEEPAFDHDRLAASLSSAADEQLTGLTLPFNAFEYVGGGTAIRFTAAGGRWRCELSSYVCARETGQDSGGSTGGGRAGRNGASGATPPRAIASPDGRYEAFIQNHNIAVRHVGGSGRDDATRMLSRDGSEGSPYTARSISWSPDSRRLAAYRVTAGYERLVHYVESSPAEQLQPRYFTRTYTKPGDALPVQHPMLFDLESGAQHMIDNALFPNAFSMSRPEWRDDGRAFTFEYNERGHELFRVIEVNAETGRARVLISEEPETFFYYRDSSNQGKKFRHDLNDGNEIIWMSERDGWNHLYLYDGTTGEGKNQITRGEWVVRDVDHVDEENRQIWFQASGVNENQDPYFIHHYRINFDGTGLTALTEADGNHEISLSPDRSHYVVTWSRVDLPPITQLRRTRDGAVIAELGRGDHSALLAAGWQPPEVFAALGRDGSTDIWGMIVRPSNFDPAKSYPVIEYIYAGPHFSHVPKSFTALPQRAIRQTAELGFIVVQIDGMGTSNRSKGFHDVAWKNLGDAGFPDRILWHQAVAERYPSYDLDHVGIYGHSAGGQNALGALLFHPEFYHVAVAGNGSHDNRMDKIWWNELWMGYPLAEHYERSSNVVNAHKLRGRLLLVVAELDNNVDPSSTFQVVDALIKADKDFDLLMLPGMGHSPGGEYGERKMFDFFVEHLLDAKPPEWNGEGISVNEGVVARPR